MYLDRELEPFDVRAGLPEGVHGMAGILRPFTPEPHNRFIDLKYPAPSQPELSFYRSFV